MAWVLRASVISDNADHGERRQGIAYFRMNGFADISHLYANDEPPSFAARFVKLMKIAGSATMTNGAPFINATAAKRKPKP